MSNKEFKEFLDNYDPEEDRRKRMSSMQIGISSQRTDSFGRIYSDVSISYPFDPNEHMCGIHFCSIEIELELHDAISFVNRVIIPALNTVRLNNVPLCN